MGTNNFNNNRSSHIYAINDSYYDDDLQETIQDDFIYEDTRSNIICSLESFDTNNINANFYEDDSISLEEELRSYPATSLGKLYTSFNYAGIAIEIELIPKTVAGYYSGFNLDYELRLEYNCSYYDSIEDLINDHLEYYPAMKGIFKIHSKLFMKILNNDIYFLIDNLELIFKSYSDPLNKVASFSDGTCLYEKAS